MKFLENDNADKYINTRCIDRLVVSRGPREPLLAVLKNGDTENIFRSDLAQLFEVVPVHVNIRMFHLDLDVSVDGTTRVCTYSMGPVTHQVFGPGLPCDRTHYIAPGWAPARWLDPDCGVNKYSTVLYEWDGKCMLYSDGEYASPEYTSEEAHVKFAAYVANEVKRDAERANKKQEIEK